MSFFEQAIFPLPFSSLLLKSTVRYRFAISILSF